MSVLAALGLQKKNLLRLNLENPKGEPQNNQV